MSLDQITAAIRALPKNEGNLRDLLISLDCYAADLYRATKDADIGAVSDALTDAFTLMEQAIDGMQTAPLTREEYRDEQAGIDGYRRAA